MRAVVLILLLGASAQAAPPNTLQGDLRSSATGLIVFGTVTGPPALKGGGGPARPTFTLVFNNAAGQAAAVALVGSRVTITGTLLPNNEFRVATIRRN